MVWSCLLPGQYLEIQSFDGNCFRNFCGSVSFPRLSSVFVLGTLEVVCEKCFLSSRQVDDAPTPKEEVVNESVIVLAKKKIT